MRPSDDHLAAALPRFPDDPGSLPASASNAWTVAPGRTERGAPLLASDPHLGFQAPSLWYLVRIDLPEGRFRAGATSPGVPLVVIGRNQDVAWGFTTTHADTQDLFVERLAGPDAYARRVAALSDASAERVADLLRPGPVLLRLAVRGFGVRLRLPDGDQPG